MALINNGQYPEDINKYGELSEELFDRIDEIETELSKRFRSRVCRIHKTRFIWKIRLSKKVSKKDMFLKKPW